MKQIIDLTSQTIDKRAKNYRNLIIAVVAATLLTIAASIITFSFQIIFCLFILFPIYGIFAWLDAKLLNKWRQQILTKWINENLNLDIFKKAMGTIPMLPPKTLKSMLDTLPESQKEKKIEINKLRASTRKAVKKTAAKISFCGNIRTMLSILGITTGACSVAASVISHSFLPLTGLIIAFAIVASDKFFAVSVFNRQIKQFLKIQNNTFEKQPFVLIVNKLDWTGISNESKELSLDKTECNDNTL